MKKSRFISRLKRAVAWDQTPKLTDEDIDELVDLARIRDSYGNAPEDVELWEPSTQYHAGQMVVNSDRETFVCVADGVSGALVPQYLKGTAEYEDGTATWVYHGTTSWTPTYDFNRAAYEGWGMKAAKAASMISFTADGSRMDRDQHIKNCEAMQRKFAITSSAKLGRGYRIVPMILEVRVDD